MRNPFKFVSKEYVRREILDAKCDIERAEDAIERAKRRIADLEKYTGCKPRTLRVIEEEREGNE